MRFAWAPVLFAVLALPVMVAIYLRRQRRRRPAVVYPSLDLVRAALPRRAGWKRHVPFALVLAALAVLTVAGARPQLRMNVPVASSAIILALDVSGSMCATDVDPNRLAAAQDAVRTFVRDQNDRTRIGLVVFSGSAQIAVAPSTDRGELIAALDGLTVGRGTAIGAAILKSVDAIALLNPDVAAPAPDSAPGQTPDHAPEIVVLLTDGANTRGVTPTDAADQAAARGVRVYPIGFGTVNPTALVCTSAQLGGDMLENPGRRGLGGGPPRNFLVADEPTLRQVATTTGGEYYAASDADQLQQVLRDLPLRVDVQQRNVEISVGLAALAGLLILLALAAAARWSAFPS
ncbi:MAG: VWA domain-containing protein [Kineosporiaceae bacterium]|nr:VWA domain-containing protein [Kineosporiaceae bacterium]